jgi:flagellar biosynthetic protein FliR
MGAMLLMTPIIDGFGIPARVRVLVVLALSACLVSSLPVSLHLSVSDPGTFFLAATRELAIGALLGFGALCAFATFSFAGNLLDQQMGFSLASVYDPMSRAQSPLITTVFGLIGVCLFFTTDAHHTLFRGFAYSLEKIPLGTALHDFSPSSLVRQFGLIFTFGLVLAAPVFFCIYLVELGLAVISRNLPQMNVFMIGIPVKIACGLILLSLLSIRMGPVFDKAFASIFRFWQEVL